MTTATLSTENLRQMLTTTQQQLQALDTERQSLALPALRGSEVAQQRLEQVEASITDGQRTVARLRDGIVLAEGEERQAEAQVEAARREQLRDQRRQLVAERKLSYGTIERATATLVAAVRTALELSLGIDALAAQAETRWRTQPTLPDAKQAIAEHISGALIAAGIQPQLVATQTRLTTEG